MNKLRYPFTCVLQIADMKVPVRLRHCETVQYFGEHVIPNQNLRPDLSLKGLSDMPLPAFVPNAEWNAWLADGGSDDGYGEYTCSTACVSDALLTAGRCIIHAVAFRYRGRAWLIAGPSGVGKSTQVKNLQSFLPGAVDVICGDRPALQLCIDGTVFVHPSPWNGKENWKGAEGAALGGLVFLERGEENSFFEIASKDAIFPLLSSLIHTAETEENIRDLSCFADAFLKQIPVYRLISHDVPESTRLMLQALFLEGGLR